MDNTGLGRLFPGQEMGHNQAIGTSWFAVGQFHAVGARSEQDSFHLLTGW